MKPRVMILHVSGTNRDHEAAHACVLAGGLPEIVHINQLRGYPPSHRLDDYQMLIIAGGFSYGDALGAGKRLALDLVLDLDDDLARFTARGKPILGIGNGFQALVKANVLAYPPHPNAWAHLRGDNQVTLTTNVTQRFVCRWVTLVPNPQSPCVFTRMLTEPIFCPVAHSEGRFLSNAVLPDGQIALRYAQEDASFAERDYPANPNGSTGGIAGMCSPNGTILGLMPHPENHLVAWQHPRWTRGERGRLGLPLFEAGLRYAAEVG